MKTRFVVATTLATLASTSFAQSSVTLYGVVDSGLLYQNTSAASFSGTAPNTGKVYRFKDGGIASSIWGLRMVEDIGGGYHVGAKLQGVFDSGSGRLGLSDTPGTAAAFNQFAMLTMSGPFGTFNAGRQIIPMSYALAATDVRGYQNFGSLLTAWIGMNTAANWPGTSTNGSIGALYDSNALVYQSPSFAGASLDLEYAPGGVAGEFQGGTRESAVARYSNYGLNVSAVYYNGHDTNPAPGTVPTGVNNNRFVYLGALYRVHGFSISASYGNGKNPAQVDEMNFDMYSGGLGYQFSPALKVTSGVYYLRDRNNSANKSLEFAVGAEYSLSKSSLVYAQAGYVDNKGTMNQTIAYGQPVAPNMRSTAAMIGMRHSF